MTATVPDELQTPPAFEDPKPDDWPPNQWRAACLIHEGSTQVVAASEAGVTRSTVAGWLSKWRKRYGREFLSDTNQDMSRDRQDKGRGDGGRATARRYKEIREELAGEMGEVSLTAAEIARVYLTEVFSDDEQMAALTIDDIDKVSKIAERLAKAAVLVSGLGTGGNGSGLEDQPTNVLDALETKPGEHAELLSRLDVSFSRFRELKSGDVIEATEVAGA